MTLKAVLSLTAAHWARPVDTSTNSGIWMCDEQIRVATDPVSRASRILPRLLFDLRHYSASALFSPGTNFRRARMSVLILQLHSEMWTYVQVI